jgi:hypothetical protein
MEARIMAHHRHGGWGQRLPARAHTSQPWRIHEITSDFRLEDVWALPTPGGPDDFRELMQVLASPDSPLRTSSSRTVRGLWAARKMLGAVFGWDEAPAGSDGRHETLRDRLPPDLACTNGDNGPRVAPFTTLYLLHDEWAAELLNRTVHGVVHIGWVKDGAGGYRGQLAVLVKPNGLFGAAYMVAILPARHLIVYPLAIRQIEQAWRAVHARGLRRLPAALVDDLAGPDGQVDVR